MGGPVLWEVVGGAEKGGIVVRTGRGVDSPPAAPRLAHGARVQEVELDGERLHYERLAGDGPDSGWVSIKLSNGNALLERVVPIWEVVGGADKGGILVRSGQDTHSQQEPTRLSTGALVAELALEGERLRYRRLSGAGPDTGWVSTRLSGKFDLLVRNGQFMREWEASRSPSAPSAPKAAATSEVAPSAVPSRPAAAGSAGAKEAPAVEQDGGAEVKPRELELGLLTSHELVDGSPAFSVRDERVSVREVASPAAEEVGALCLGDVAVVDGDLDLLPWVKLPRGSRVRRSEDLARTLVLKDDAFLCAEVGELTSAPTAVALRCADDCAAVHFSSCGCQHWEVVHTLVLIVEGPSEKRKRAGLLKQGDILCPGASTLREPAPEGGAEWIRAGQDGRIWRLSPPVKQRGVEREFPLPVELGGAASALLEGGRTDGFILKRHAELGALVAPLELRRFQEGPAQGGKQSESEDEQVGGKGRGEGLKGRAPLARAGPAQGGKEPPEEAEEEAEEVPAVAPLEFEQRGPLEVRVDPLPEPELSPEEAWEAMRRELEAEGVPVKMAWVVAGDASTGVLPSTRALEPQEEPLLRLRAGDVLLQTWSAVKRPLPGVMWTMLRAGDKVYRGGHLLANVRQGLVWVMVCTRSGEEVLQPCGWEDGEGLLVQVCSGFGEPWAVQFSQVIVRSKCDTAAPSLGFVAEGDIVGVEDEIEPYVGRPWTRVSDASDVRQRNALVPEPVVAADDGVFILKSNEVLGTLLRPLRDEERPSLHDPRLLISPARLGIYRRVAEICHRRIWVDNVDTLWNGDRERILPLADIEAKFLERGVTVLHARRRGRFVGGAIVRSVSVKNFVGGIHITGTKIHFDAEEAESNYFTQVAYVDCCATERGSRAGRALWEAIGKLPVPAVALHSVLLPATLDFWRACGMMLMDVNDPADQFKLLQCVQSVSDGRVSLVLPELVKALPQHSLPLFVWANPGFSIALQQERGGAVPELW